MNENPLYLCICCCVFVAKAGYADFIQPSLGPLQPNLDDIMDTLEPLNGNDIVGMYKIK